MMHGVSYVIYGCTSARTTPGVSLYRSLANAGGRYFCSYYSRQGDDDNLKRKTKNQTLCIVGYSYEPKFFNILAIGQKYFSFYPTANFFMVNNFSVD